MTDSERIEALEKKITSLRDALVGLACGRTLSLDAAGNPVVIDGWSSTGVNVTHSFAASPCNGSHYQHHMKTSSGLCCCQDFSWAR